MYVRKTRVQVVRPIASMDGLNRDLVHMYWDYNYHFGEGLYQSATNKAIISSIQIEKKQ
jgi:hypothetical protein